MTDFVRNSASCPVSSIRLVYSVHLVCSLYTCTVVSGPGVSQGSTCVDSCRPLGADAVTWDWDTYNWLSVLSRAGLVNTIQNMRSEMRTSKWWMESLLSTNSSLVYSLHGVVRCLVLTQSSDYSLSQWVSSFSFLVTIQTLCVSICWHNNNNALQRSILK